MSLLCPFTARLIHGPRDGLKVRRVAAMTHSAQVVELKTNRNRPVDLLERPTVGEDLFVHVEAEISVSIANLSCFPQPARTQVRSVCRNRAVAINF
jgi:hypothetical protein